MKSAVLTTSMLLGATQASKAQSIIISTSSGYHNYRHQADACRAYQMLSEYQSEEDIILMSFDDVRMSHANPWEGALFSSPEIEVATGCNVEYRGKSVNKQTFQAVLMGDKETAGGRVLKTEGDAGNVFIYIVGNGAPDIISFPGEEHLFFDELQETINFMYENQMYDNLVIYMDTPFAGQYLSKIADKSKRVYAVSGSNKQQFATICPPDEQVNNKHMKTCTADLFSYIWMNDVAMHKDDTFEKSFTRISKDVEKSQVHQWGDLKIAEHTMASFFGKSQPHLLGATQNLKTEDDQETAYANYRYKLDRMNQNSLQESDARFQYIYGELIEAAVSVNHLKLQYELTHRMRVDAIFQGINPESFKNLDVDFEFDESCYKSLIYAYRTQCAAPTGEGGDQGLGIDEYTLKYFPMFARACQDVSQTKTYVDKVFEACNH